MGNYLTVAEELQPTADCIKSWYEGHGYAVKIENRKRQDCPFLVALECKRLQTTLLVDVRSKVPDKETLQEWTSYCRAQRSDTRYVLVLPGQNRSLTSLMPLKGLGIGLILVGKTFTVHEEFTAQDFTVSGGLPSLKRRSKRTRELLGPAWEVLATGDFVQGFDDACVAFEGEARKYLIRHLGRRVHILDARGLRKNPSTATIKKMTMGALAIAFAQIDGANHADSSIGKILKELNPTRVKAAHHRRDGRANTAIRRSGPALLWKIAQGTELCLN